MNQIDSSATHEAAHQTLPSSAKQANSPNSHDACGARILLWESLAQGDRHLLIRHNGQDYQLRETRNGKLILTK